METNQPHKSLEELYALWENLGNIGLHEEGESDEFKEGTLVEDFLHFPKGTNPREIWRWFEKQNPNFSAGEVMNGAAKKSPTLGM